MEVIKRESYLNTNENIYISKSIYPSGIHEHVHEFLELVYICSGNAVHVINGSEYNVTCGDLFFLNFNTYHTIRQASSDFLMITCAFMPEMVDQSLVQSENAMDILQLMLFKPFFGEMTDPIFSINLMGKQQEFESVLEGMNTEYLRKEKGYQNVLKASLIILLTKIFRLSEFEKENGARKNCMDIIKTAVHYLKDNYTKTLRMEDIARQVFLSPNYFASLFKNTTGLSLTDYVHQLRISEACKLLQNTRLSVMEVMHRVGYQDAKFFYQVFKRHTGMTPGTYKRR